MEFKDPRHQNLFILAGYLLNLPRNYKHFDMQTYIRDPEYGGQGGALESDLLKAKTVPECGAVACAVGHCIDAGFKPKKERHWFTGEMGIDWKATSEKYFVDPVSDAWGWMFSSYWSDVDNTPQGAALRICWYITNGLPDNWDDQMSGDAPLCYR